MLRIIGVDIEHQVDFCISGQLAVDKLIERYQSSMTYKIIFTDYKMPIMDGVEATKQIRKLLKDKFDIPL